MTPRRLGLTVAAAALLADQLFKNLMLYGVGFSAEPPPPPIELLPFLDLTMVWNRGISYGLLQCGSATCTVSLGVFQLAAAVGLTWWLFRLRDRLLAVAVGLLIGGALGNVIDRILYGAVADFFYFHAWGRGWYVFNIADIAITFGVVLLLADMVVGPKASEPNLSGSRSSGRKNE
jgi:signal peptidase II